MRRSDAPLQVKRSRTSIEPLQNGSSFNSNNNYNERSQPRTPALASSLNTSFANLGIPKVPGRLAGVELQNFMCHARLKLTFNVEDRNCYYIVGPNGSGKSALFAGINIALGGKGRSNDRGNALQSYIKEGETSARVRVILTNEGTGSLPEYGEQIVIERLISSTSTTYCIKSRRKDGSTEELKSRRKYDLDRILTKFQIELDNPLSWLSQDRARQFLQMMKPEKLYDIFMISSDLESTRQIYEQISSYQDEAKCHIEAGEEKKNQLKEEYEKLLLRYKSSVKIEELSKRKSRAEWLLLWAVVRDVVEQIEAETIKLEKLAAKKAEFEAESLQFAEQKEALSNEKDSLMQNVDVHRNEMNLAKTRLDTLNTSLRRTERDMINAKSLIKRKQDDLTSADRELRQTQVQLDRLLGNSDRDLDSEENEILRQKGEILQQQTELNDRLEEAKQRKQECNENYKKSYGTYKDSEFELKELYDKLDQIEKDKELYLSAQKNRLNLLGPDVLKIRQLIKTNPKAFDRPPMGPLGEFIKMKKEHLKWATPVEFCLRNVLNNFICFSPRDRQALERMCNEKRIRVPDLIVTSYVENVVNTAQSEPPEEYATILRVIDVSHPTIYNTLVDQLSIEDYLLLEKDDEARKLMYNNPPRNARQALTQRCSQVYPRSEHKPYRFYTNQNAQEARFLVNNANSALARRDFAREKQEIESKIPQQRQQTEQAKKAVISAENELKAISSNCHALAAKKTELENALRHLDEKNQELQKVLSSGTLIENFRATLQENQNIREQLLEDLQNAKRHLKDCIDERDRINIELDESKSELKTIELEFKKIEGTLKQNGKQMQEVMDMEMNFKNKLGRCEQIRKKIEDKIEGLTADKARLSERCQLEKGSFTQPDDFNDPPDFAKLLETEVLKAKLKEFNAQISVQEQIRKHEVPSLEEVEKKRDMGKILNKRIRAFQGYMKRFSDAVEVRRKKFNILKFTLPMELEREFKEQMLMRNYNGTLHVDHDAHAIVITVDTHKGGHHVDNPNQEDEVDGDDENGAGDDAQTQRAATRRRFVGGGSQATRENRYKKRIAQDLKGLSGGERSYTTACFVMALWKCVDSPFRCLDEFDVFMDMLNRRVVMEMLVDLAMDHKRNQFFFFTPQGINELKGRSNIEIFDLPKVRDM